MINTGWQEFDQAEIAAQREAQDQERTGELFATASHIELATDYLAHWKREVPGNLFRHLSEAKSFLAWMNASTSAPEPEMKFYFKLYDSEGNWDGIKIFEEMI